SYGADEGVRLAQRVVASHSRYFSKVSTESSCVNTFTQFSGPTLLRAEASGGNSAPRPKAQDPRAGSGRRQQSPRQTTRQRRGVRGSRVFPTMPPRQEQKHSTRLQSTAVLAANLPIRRRGPR